MQSKRRMAIAVLRAQGPDLQFAGGYRRPSAPCSDSRVLTEALRSAREVSVRSSYTAQQVGAELVSVALGDICQRHHADQAFVPVDHW